MRKLLSILVVIAMLFTCCAALAEGEGSKYSLAVITRGTNVNLRKKPGGDIITKIPRGTCVYIADAQMKGDKLWYQIIASLKNDHANYIGWMDASYLTDVCDIYTNVAEAAVGDRHVLLMMSDGSVATFGFEFQGNLDIGKWGRVESIAAGRYRSFGLSGDGMTVYAHDVTCQSPELAIRKIIADVSTDAVRVIDARGRMIANCYDREERWRMNANTAQEMENRVTDAHAAEGILAYITEDNVLHVSDMHEINENVVKANGLRRVRKAVASGYNVAVLLQDGTVRSYGDLPQEALGRIATWQNVSDIAAGRGFVAALMADGTMRFAGEMSSYNWDYRDAVGAYKLDLETEGLLEDWRDIVSITAGDHMLIGVTAEGRLRVFAEYCYE